MHPNVRRAFIITISILLLLVAGIYCYIRYDLLKAKDYKPDPQKAVSVLDLRPAIIAKLQQLVKDGSDSLYRLSIDTLRPDMIASTLDAIGVRLDIDTPSYRRLNAQKLLPDDVFSLSFSSLHIDGISIDELLHKRNIDAGNISFKNPRIEVWHRPQHYNHNERALDNSKTLYDRIREEAEHISIGSILISGGSFIHHSAASAHSGFNTERFSEVSIKLSDVLIDSTTAHDKSRVFFAKKADLECGPFSLPAADSNYLFAVGALKISSEAREVIATNILLKPRGGRAGAVRRQKTRGEIYDLEFPEIKLNGVDWQALINRESLLASEVDVMGGVISVYLSKEKPISPGIVTDVFPQQLLAKSGLPVSLSELKVSRLLLGYEEFDPAIGKSSLLTFNDLSLNGHNITNIPAEINKNNASEMDAHCLLMNSVPLAGNFTFNLEKRSHGGFSAHLHAGSADHSVLEIVAERMGLISIPAGKMQHASVQVSGNVANIKGNVSMVYNDLHIIPLDKKKDDDGRQHRKKVTGFLANTFLIKNNNPGADGKLREPDFTLARGQHGNFFNFVWSGIKVGMLKAIGVPPKFVM